MKPNFYLYNYSQKNLLEILEFGEPFRSWFNNNDHLLSSGSIYLTTKIDPIFFALFYIERECKTHYVPLEDILSDNINKNLSLLKTIVSMDQLQLV